jgi:C4-dicarboxylate-specific signal transduction histidine kinase
MEPFLTTRASGSGTGLGLAIAKEIVTHRRGALSIGPRTPGGARGRKACIEVPAVASGE